MRAADTKLLCIIREMINSVYVTALTPHRLHYLLLLVVYLVCILIDEDRQHGIEYQNDGDLVIDGENERKEGGTGNYAVYKLADIAYYLRRARCALVHRPHKIVVKGGVIVAGNVKRVCLFKKLAM